MLCTVVFESIQLILFTAWCPGHRLWGTGLCARCLTSGLFVQLLHTWLQCPEADMLSHEQTQCFVFSVGSARMVTLSHPHQAAGTEFRTSTLYNSLLSLEAHSERETERRAKKILLRSISANVYTDGVNHTSFTALTAWFLDVQRLD
jgi:hypothetical protein